MAISLLRIWPYCTVEQTASDVNPLTRFLPPQRFGPFLTDGDLSLLLHKKEQCPAVIRGIQEHDADRLRHHSLLRSIHLFGVALVSIASVLVKGSLTHTLVRKFWGDEVSYARIAAAHYRPRRLETTASGLLKHKQGELSSYDLRHLLRLNAAGTHSANWIQEIWSIDMPNHGESAALNRAHLEDRQERGRKEGWDGKCNTMDFSTYLNAFLSITQLQDHQVVGIAHSGSCTSWTHALTLLGRTHPHPFALVFIEPTLIFPDLPPTDPRIVHGTANVRGVLAKRDKWSNRAEAKRCLLGTEDSKLEGRPKSQSQIDKNANKKGSGKGGGTTVWSKWDDQALDLFVEHALEEVREPAQSPAGCTKWSFYRTVEPAQLMCMCEALNPGRGRGTVGGVHIIWLEVEDFITKSARGDILDATSHRVLSHGVVSDVGHLIPQENPGGLADALYDVLLSRMAVSAGLTVQTPL
ncbi:hypothetical protein EV401DRAFT_1887726 [Pisolithus croceorrhizus]|nr:hypothetical protein EV401DRAFT_1887726 [Pisolithus croceorrhizus]